MAIKNLKYWLIAILLALLVLCVVQMQSCSEREPAELFTHPNRYTAISAGYNHCLALRSDGSIVAWGDNEWGKAEPPDGNDFIAIAAGHSHSLALISDGSIVSWGTFDKVKPPDGNDFVAIAAGCGNSLALRANGSIVGWGDNWRGKANPPDGNDFIAIAADVAGDYNLALKKDGSIVGWGYGRHDQSNIPSGKDFVAISVGGSHCLALKSDGGLVEWGRNLFNRNRLPAGDVFVAIAVGCGHDLALKSDGSIVGWGNNARNCAQPPKGNDFIAIATGNLYSLALNSEGTLVGWGDKSVLKPPILPQPKINEKDNKKIQEQNGEVVEVKNISSLKHVEPLPKTIRLTGANKIKVDLIFIEPDSFTMGRHVGWLEKFESAISSSFMIGEMPDEWPPRKVKITKGFYIGKYKVTCRQFCTFLNSIEKPKAHIYLNEYSRIEIKDGAYVPKPDCENCAINNVRWKGAVAFCEWLSKQTGFTVRLPTEAEWEFVARGPEGRTYPWGEDENVKFFENRAYEYEKYPHPWSTPPVDALPGDVTPDGVVGLAGAGGEWCSDFYLNHYLKDDVIDPKGPSKKFSFKPTSRSQLTSRRRKEYRVYRSEGRVTTYRGFGNTVGDLEMCNGLRIVVELPTQ